MPAGKLLSVHLLLNAPKDPALLASPRQCLIPNLVEVVEF